MKTFTFHVMENIITGRKDVNGKAEIICKVHKANLSETKARSLADTLNSSQESDEFPIHLYIAQPA